MKNVVIAGELNYLVGQQDSFLSRATVQVSIAGTTDEMLELHRRDLADLIIVPLDLPGTSIEQVCITIRSDALLRPVQLILIAPNTRSAIEQASRCRPNALVLRPVNAAVLLSRAQQLLDVSARETFRVLINVAVNGSERNTTFFCRSYDISNYGHADRDRPDPSAGHYPHVLLLPA